MAKFLNSEHRTLNTPSRKNLFGQARANIPRIVFGGGMVLPIGNKGEGFCKSLYSDKDRH